MSSGEANDGASDRKIQAAYASLARTVGRTRHRNRHDGVAFASNLLGKSSVFTPEQEHIAGLEAEIPQSCPFATAETDQPMALRQLIQELIQ